MSNGYFNFTTPVIARTLARAETINAIFASVAAGFDTLPDPAILNGLASAGFVGIAFGGTGATSAAAARTNLSLYSIAQVDAADALRLPLTGGTLTGNLFGTGCAFSIGGTFGTIVCTGTASVSGALTAASLTLGTALAVAQGGTGATTAAAARTALGLGSAALNATGDFAGSAGLSGLTNPSAARTALGLGTAAQNNTGDFVAAGGNAGNVTGVVAVANGGTGATTAANARTALGVTATGADAAYATPASLAAAVANYLPLAGGTLSGGLGFGGRAPQAGLALNINGPDNNTASNFVLAAYSANGTVGTTYGWNNISSSGTYTIKASTGSMALDTSGNLVVSGNITASSDARLKADVVQLRDSLAAVNRMRGVRYRDIASGERRIGVIAQEIEAVRPEYVHTHTGEDGFKSVAYGNIVADLIEAVKTLAAEVDALKAAA